MPAMIHYASSRSLPKLGWLAAYHLRSGRLSVLHGTAVECRDRWMVEGVWDGPFPDGGFHRAAHLFGSGVRLDDDAVHFVPSCALVDRLLCCRDGDTLVASNSLIVLLAATGARLDDRHDYVEDAKAILEGTDRYDTRFAIRHPRIETFHQIYYKSLVVRNGEPALERRADPRGFGSFDEYRSALSERLRAICDNGRDPARQTRLAAFGTLSAGYDSSATTALVKELGVRRCFTFSGSWAKETESKAEFDTAPLAAALGVEAIRLDRTPTDPVDELLLRASSPLGQQLPLLWMARYLEQHVDAAFVFTGYHGDIIWDLNVPEEHVTPEIKRHDMSGLDLSELRLKSGFFNVAVPFLFASSIESIVELSKLPEMAPWRLGNRYDRPISRRIVEEAGVPRGLFGVRKGGIFIAVSRPAHPLLRRQYFASLRSRHALALPMAYCRLGCDKLALLGLAKASKLVTRKPGLGRVEHAIKHEFEALGEGKSPFGRENFRVSLYRWSVEELARRLGAGLATEPDATAVVGPEVGREAAAS